MFWVSFLSGEMKIRERSEQGTKCYNYTRRILVLMLYTRPKGPRNFIEIFRESSNMTP